jgi:hypothetical protein
MFAPHHQTEGCRSRRNTEQLLQDCFGKQKILGVGQILWHGLRNKRKKDVKFGMDLMEVQWL